MKKESIWHRSIWDNKVGKFLFPFVGLAALIFFAFQGLRGVLTGEALMVGYLGFSATYDGIEGRLLGAAYICAVSFLVLEAVVWYRHPREGGIRIARYFRIILPSLFVLFLWSAILTWRA